jgi:hypothetical protein
VGAVLDLIERLPVRVVIPGHGAPFTDVAGALQRARARLAGFRADARRHSHHAAKVLLKYHLLEEGRQPLAGVLRWVERTPLAHAVWQRLGQPQGSLAAWGQALIDELVAAGSLMRRDGDVLNN